MWSSVTERDLRLRAPAHVAAQSGAAPCDRCRSMLVARPVDRCLQIVDGRFVWRLLRGRLVRCADAPGARVEGQWLGQLGESGSPGHQAGPRGRLYKGGLR